MNLESNRGIKAESTRRKFRRRFFLAFLSFDTVGLIESYKLPRVQIRA